LAGGEIQRVKLASQLGANLSGLIYILDEPTIGLHSRDVGRLLKTLKKLRDLGNTVIVVEHDAQTIREADWIIDLGPGAGEYGGEVVAEGTPTQIMKNKKSLTGKYLAASIKEGIAISSRPLSEKGRTPRNGSVKRLKIKGASAFNLKNIDVEIPLGTFTCITGVSGSGKSTLMIEILAKALSRKFYGTKEKPGQHKAIFGMNYLDKIINVDQSPIGRSPRSNPATYTGLFSYIRDLFTQVPEAKIRGYGPGQFSFNLKDGGRCRSCGGEGAIKVEMQSLPDVYIKCQECQGSRYDRKTLEIHWQGKNIAQVLDLTVEEAMDFFKEVPIIWEKLKILWEVGLGYLKLGQPATTLSGGEAQRIKLASELGRRSTGRTLYILDEPTTGLHFEDIKKLLQVLKKLVEKGNTVLVIEHNLEVIREADWIVDLGPEGGEEGGYLVAAGSLEEIIKSKDSYTGKYLKKVI
jgi:excinuclease ABC subunit A